MARVRNRELGPAMRPVGVPDDLGSSMLKASGRIELPLHIRWRGPVLTTTSTTVRIGPAFTTRFCGRRPRASPLSPSRPSSARSLGRARAPPAVRDAWAERIAVLRDEAEGFALAWRAAIKVIEMRYGSA